MRKPKIKIRYKKPSSKTLWIVGGLASVAAVAIIFLVPSLKNKVESLVNKIHPSNPA